MKLNQKTTAFLFPGQGSQSVGMGRDLAESNNIAKQTFKEADDILGFSLSRLMWDGPENELNDTLNTQPALYVHSVAAQRVINDILPGFFPAFTAGHSLGEFSALTTTGALSFGEGLKLVRRRGEVMKHAGETNPGSMAAILGLDIANLENICAQASTQTENVQVANDNCPSQVVISGAKPALARAVELAKQAGARKTIPLAVSIASHSPLMKSAQAAFATAVDESILVNSTIPVISNVTAQPMTRDEEFRADIKAQLTSRVRWTESIQFIFSQGVTIFVEIGCGNVLIGLLKRIAPDAIGIPFGMVQDINTINQ